MNLPNQLTIARILLLPILLGLYYFNPEAGALNTWTYGFVGVFVIASLTDFFDGFIARRTDTVTTFGKFLDPLADKMLVLLGLLILQELSLIPMWTVFLIIAREFLVTGVRLVAVNVGKVISASNLGKAKTAVTLLAMTALFLTFETSGLILYYIALVLTVVSGIEYMYVNREVIMNQK
jgi:CDP-diacylglycerol--glycerol-3-phosphate 3-phosphatidyltransferase